MGKERQIARAASKVAKQYLPGLRQSGKMARHILPAAFKPVHSLWHEILAFIFLMFAGIVAWKIWKSEGSLNPGELLVGIVFIILMGGYGISSWRKSRRISRT